MKKSSSSRQKTKNTPLPPKEKIRFSFSRFMFLKWASTQPAIVKSIQIIVKFCDGFPGIKPFSSFFHCTGNFFKTSFFLGKCFFFYYNTHDVVHFPYEIYKRIYSERIMLRRKRTDLPRHFFCRCSAVPEVQSAPPPAAHTKEIPRLRK